MPRFRQADRLSFAAVDAAVLAKSRKCAGRWALHFAQTTRRGGFGLNSVLHFLQITSFPLRPAALGLRARSATERPDANLQFAAGVPIVQRCFPRRACWR